MTEAPQVPNVCVFLTEQLPVTIVQIGLYLISATLRPTNNNRSTYGIYCSPYAEPHSTNTITTHPSRPISTIGSAASGDYYGL